MFCYFLGPQEGKDVHCSMFVLKQKRACINEPESGPLSSTVTKAEAGQLFAHRSWVRMALVPLFPILFCAKCNAEK